LALASVVPRLLAAELPLTAAEPGLVRSTMVPKMLPATSDQLRVLEAHVLRTMMLRDASARMPVGAPEHVLSSMRFALCWARMLAPRPCR
jgi:hypothetical protein